MTHYWVVSLAQIIIFNLQNTHRVFNRYTYALNNPLKYTDPDGEFWNIVIGAAIGGVMNWFANGAEFSAKGLAHFWYWCCCWSFGGICWWSGWFRDGCIIKLCIRGSCRWSSRLCRRFLLLEQEMH